LGRHPRLVTVAAAQKLGCQWAIVHLQTLTHRASRPTINAETHETLVLPLLRQLPSEAWQGEARMIAVRLRTY
jgi:hypothetical protein